MRMKRAKHKSDKLFQRSVGRKLTWLKVLSICVMLAVLVIAFVRAETQPKVVVPPAQYESVEGIEVALIHQEDNCSVEAYYPCTENEQVNASVKAFVDDTIERFKGNTSGKSSRIGGTDELSVSLKVTRFDKDLVSFLFHSYTRYKGQRSLEHSINTMTFDLSSGEQYDIAAIFNKDKSDESLQTLSQLAYNGLKEVYGETEETSNTLKQGTAPTDENFSLFALDKDTLRLYLPQCQIDASQKDTFDIPLETIKSLLSKRLLPAEEPPEPTKPSSQGNKPGGPSNDGKKLVAFTFDDGPHGKYTPRLLDILKAENIHATFFILGCNISNAPEAVTRAAQEGHQVASHTFNHKNLTKLSQEKQKQEIDDTADLIEKLTGSRPTGMRPPYGAKDKTLLSRLDTPLILWSLDTRDWDVRNADTIYKHVMETVKNGDIVLFHDIYETSVAAAERLIPALKKQGYTFVTVDELLAARGEAGPGDVVHSRR